MNERTEARRSALATVPMRIVDAVVAEAMKSPCQSKRGAAVFSVSNGVALIEARGHNTRPDGACTGSDECKATCRETAVHAEQMALLHAGRNAMRAHMVHLKVVDGRPVVSGVPSCLQCSKLMLAAGVAFVWLLHEAGWRCYPMADFHRATLVHWAELEAVAPPVGYLKGEALP